MVVLLLPRPVGMDFGWWHWLLILVFQTFPLHTKIGLRPLPIIIILVHQPNSSKQATIHCIGTGCCCCIISISFPTCLVFLLTSCFHRLRRFWNNGWLGSLYWTGPGSLHWSGAYKCMTYGWQLTNSLKQIGSGSLKKQESFWAYSGSPVHSEQSMQAKFIPSSIQGAPPSS